MKAAWHLVEPDVPFVPGWHIEAICRHLEAVYRGEIPDLLINIPPGCCKSLITCVFWPAWIWALNPAKRFLFASYGQELATRDSVRCRQVLTSPWYQAIWGERFNLADDQNQKIRFENDKGGWRLATSVGGRGTGEHPDFIVVDDPHNVKQADSPAKRQDALNWWQGTVATRGRTRGVRRVVIMQRLDEGDLSAHIIKSGKFEHVCLPMEFEPGRMKPTKLGFDDPRLREGELLWPALFDIKLVAALKADLGPVRAAGQLQQRPTPAGGAIFQAPWLRYYKIDGEYRWLQIPYEGGIRRFAVQTSALRTFIIADLAVSQKTSADYTTLFCWGDDRRGNLLLLDALRERMEAPDVLPTAWDMLRRWNAQYVGIESYGFQLSMVQTARRQGMPIKELRHRVPQSDKIAHSVAAQVRMQAGQLWFPEQSPWLQVVIDEILQFRVGCAHDDVVDNMSYAAEEMVDLYDKGKMSPPRVLHPGPVGGATPYTR